MFTHFGNRLKRDLKVIVERRLDASVAASGSVLKVAPSPSHHYTRLTSFTQVIWCRSRCHFAQAAALRRVVWWFSIGIPSRILCFLPYQGAV